MKYGISSIKIFECFDVINSKMATPIEINFHIDTTTHVLIVPYGDLIASLLHVTTIIRRVIMFAASF